MKVLQLNKLSNIKSTADSFNNLPHTDHKDGKYRLRRYSVVEIRTTFWDARTEAVVTHLPHRDFVQSEELNKHQGGMIRSFDEIEAGVLESEGMKEMCLVFMQGNDLAGGQEIEIHQMRVLADDKTGDTTPVSPEGIHQDGFDCIAMVGVSRSNTEGGELLVYNNKESDPFVIHKLSEGEIIMLDDRKLWHNATPLKKINTSLKGYADWFILCAARK